MQRSIFLCALLLYVLLLCSLAMPLSSHAAPADSVITDCSNDAQLRSAVAAGGVITFACASTPANIPISTYMQVAGTVTIDGNNSVALDGGGLQAFFQVFAAGKLTLRNIILKNGRFNAVHPIEVFGEATLEKVTLQNNRASDDGGAIVLFSNRLMVNNSTFTDNTVGAANSTMTSSGGALQIDGGAATVQFSTFANNQALSQSSSLGGAIRVKSGSLAVTDSSFTGNRAFDGGALYIDSGTVVTLTRTIFTNNSAGYGGAIESNGEVQIDYSTFRQNQATVGDGGALWVLNSDADITYSTFSNNSAQTTGGAISCYANTLSVIHSTLSDNQAAGHGGGIYSTCNVNLTNSTLSSNRAVGQGGGALYQAGDGSANIAAVTIAGNSAAFGAGVYNDSAGNSAVALQYTLLANNSVGNCDGLITSQGYNLSSDTNCATFTQAGDQQNVTLALGPLTNNGGPTETQLPQTGNPAIDAIPTALCGFATDQRDVVRPQGSQCDIGAIEVAARQWLYLPLITRQDLRNYAWERQQDAGCRQNGGAPGCVSPAR